MAKATQKEKHIGVVLLAAGSSSRLGRAKQLLPYKGRTLLQYSLEQALASKAQTVLAVLGANADASQKEIVHYNVHLAINEGWQEGMGSSIRTGIEAITKLDPLVNGVILVVCDQPFMTAALLNTLIEVHQKAGKGIVTCSYDNTFGPPVLFSRSYFAELLLLKGDVGARSIVRQHADNVEAIPFPEGTLDIDTEKDYESIKDSR